MLSAFEAAKSRLWPPNRISCVRVALHSSLILQDQGAAKPNFQLGGRQIAVVALKSWLCGIYLCSLALQLCVCCVRLCVVAGMLSHFRGGSVHTFQ